MGPSKRHGVARVISKLGLGSRTQATRWVGAGRVRVNGVLVHDADFPVIQGVDSVSVDDQPLTTPRRVVIMLNKPRGLVTTARDERGRDTVYRCLEDAELPWIAPVGRLDKASEGLLLFTNDSVWAARVTDPDTGPPKRYHVQIDRLPDRALLAGLEGGVVADGQPLRVAAVSVLRQGERHAWLDILLEEGRNRQIRRLLSAFNVAVLRLVRVAIGPLQLGELPKGAWRILTDEEIRQLAC